jgi:hypothetical protein
MIFPTWFLASQVIETRFGIGAFAGMWDYFLDDPKRSGAFNLISPVLFLGGLMVAVVSNLFAATGIRLRKEPGSLIEGTITLYPRTWNLAVLVLAGTLFIAMMGYAALENLTPH